MTDMTHTNEKMHEARQGRRSRLGAFALALIAAFAWACVNASDIVLLEIGGEGVLFWLVYLDLDGTGTLTAGDEPIGEIDVILSTSGTADVIDQATTDTLGVFILEEVPVGSYTLGLDAAALGDSLELLGSSDPITVAIGDTTVVNLGATYEVLSMSEALAAPLGQRVFTSGIALNSRVNFGDAQVHFVADDSVFLRGINVERSPVNPGDSVRLLGRVVSDNGRPALDEVTPSVLIPAAVLVLPEDVSTAQAYDADGARLDAALVRIRNAEMTDTSTNVDGHFRFWADDGSDSVEVVIRDFLALNTAAFRPDTVIRISRLTGLLSPYDPGGGPVQWRILPRGGGDIVLEAKLADISVDLTLDTAQASLGDTVEVTVVTENAGPLTATGLQVEDTIPTALTFVSATQTSGSYDSATGIWDLGDFASGASDTLRIRMEVIDGTPAAIPIIAESLGLILEIDPVPDNDGAVLILTIS